MVNTRKGLSNAAVCIYFGGLFELAVYLGLLALVFIGFHRELECIIIDKLFWTVLKLINFDYVFYISFF